MPATQKNQSETIRSPETRTSQPASRPLLLAETQLDMFRQMLRIRRLEERATQLYGQGKIGGFCHLYIGQEAVAVGACANLRPDDYVITTYRDHGMALVRGIGAETIFAELMGRATGSSQGRGGSMHLFSKEHNFLGGHAIVGAHIPLATGFAFASKYRDEDRVALCFFGEGAVNNGAFHESLNLASLWKLPIVFICENNRYGMGTPIERASSVYDIHKKAEGYDMDHECLDGMDVLEVYGGVQRAVEKARVNKPSFLEVRTYRFRGHSMSDPIHSHYRTKAEVEEQKQRDPITLLRAEMVESQIASDDQLKQIDAEVNEEMKNAMIAAEAAPEPAVETVSNYVYAE